MSTTASNEIENFTKIAEIKRIFTTLSTDFLKTKPKCLVVTSALRSEGKTTTTASLAATAALQSDCRVLAVDLNWHRSALHTCFGLSPTFDAATFSKEKNLSKHVQPSGIKNLDILTAVPSVNKTNGTGTK